MEKTRILEEIFNGITHGLGFFLAVIGFVAFMLFHKSAPAIEIAGMIVFCVALMTEYLISALLHSLSFTKARHVFFLMDQSTIFLLIAGTYTAFLARIPGSPAAIGICICVWTLAITGIVLNIALFEKMKKITLIGYVLIGWTVLFIAKPVYASIGPVSFLLTLAGGIFYTNGVFFYLRKFAFSHTIWHVFVMLGSVCQFVALYRIYA